jgi:hypothetical protein
MDINISTFMHLFIRLCPFILVCFFTISSIFNNDLKGIVYLMGLIFAVGIIIMIGSGIIKVLENVIDFKIVGDKQSICDIISFGSSEFSKIPISESIISFTFLYLLTHMISVGNKEGTNLVKSNWPTMVFFSLLIMIELYQNTNAFHWITKTDRSYCYDWKTSGIAYILGGLLGWIWAAIILSSNTPEFQYFNTYTRNEKCDKVSNTQYKCRVFKNGEEILDADTVKHYIANTETKP